MFVADHECARLIGLEAKLAPRLAVGEIDLTEGSFAPVFAAIAAVQ